MFTNVNSIFKRGIETHATYADPPTERGYDLLSILIKREFSQNVTFHNSLMLNLTKANTKTKFCYRTNYRTKR